MKEGNELKEKQTNSISLSYRFLNYEGTIKPESKELIELAREFRRNPTPAEKKLWGYLKNKMGLNLIANIQFWDISLIFTIAPINLP